MRRTRRIARTPPRTPTTGARAGIAAAGARAGLAATRARFGAALLLTLFTVAACARHQTADLVLQHGKIVTVDSTHPEAQALAVVGERIAAVGSDSAIAPWIGPQTKVIDLQGRLAVPGFIESHGHFMGLGASLMELDLRTAHSWDDIVAMVRDAAKTAKPGEWIIGRGWHQEKWDHPPQPNVDGLPYNTSLSAASPDNPVLLTHASGHGAYGNAKAFELAGIGPGTPNPPGGEIVRDAKGVAIGMLRDRAVGLLRRAMSSSQASRTPEQVQARLKKQAELAAQDAIKKGITSFQDQGESFRTIAMLRQMAADGDMPIRLYAMVSAAPPESLEVYLPKIRVIGFADHHFTVRALGEIISDGALGTHSAWFLKPYDDVPTTTGLNVTPMAQIKAMAEVALKDSFQVAVHAIGDRANHETLDVYDSIFTEHPDVDPASLRWRIEHAQHLEPSDIPRFGQMHVIASMQGIHACSDGPYVVKRLGEARAREGAYVWHSLLSTGAVIANGTDVPVEDEDPIPNFACSVSRILKDGSAFFPDQSMTRMQALRSYTLDGAYAEFMENEKGSLTPGKLADIVVLSRDIMTVPVPEITQARVLYTIIGGKVAYQAGG
ncbi:MAG: amidohydrolase [Gemmatimonadota bacterium]